MLSFSSSSSSTAAAPTAQDFLRVLRGLQPLFTAELAAVSVTTDRFGTVTREEFPALLARVEASARAAQARANQVAAAQAVVDMLGEDDVYGLASAAQLAEDAHYAALEREADVELLYGAEARLRGA